MSFISYVTSLILPRPIYLQKTPYKVIIEATHSKNELKYHFSIFYKNDVLSENNWLLHFLETSIVLLLHTALFQGSCSPSVADRRGRIVLYFRDANKYGR